MEKLCAIYLRVSTEDQNPQNQIAGVKKLAEALNYEVFETYIDTESGQYSDRKEFQRLMSDAQKGRFQTLFIWALDRFSREGIKTTLEHIEKLKEFGVGIKSYQEQWLDTTNEGIWQLLVAVLSYAAREEVKRFKERSMAGKKTRLSQGKLIGCYPPYGYRHIKRDKEKGIDAYFEINESEAEVVRKIFRWYLELESIFLVASRLREQGTKSRGKGRQEPGYFQTSTVSKILRSESCIGNHYFGKTTPCIPKYHIHKVRKHRLTGRRINPKSEWQLTKIPAIMDKETFYRVQEIMKKRAKFRSFKSKYEFLCQGVIRCVRCGKSYGGRSQRGFLLYRCPQCENSNFNQPTCHARSMGRDKLDGIIWGYVSSLISNQERIIKNVRILHQKRAEEESSNQRVYENLLSEKNSLKLKKSKLLNLYSEPGKVLREDLDVEIEKLNEQEKIIDKQILEVKTELENIDNLSGAEKEIDKICQLYRQKIHYS